MIGSGAIETQPTLAASVLPGSAVIVQDQEVQGGSAGSVTAAAGPAATAQANANSKIGAASAIFAPSFAVLALSVFASLFARS